jgi:hypothetical protein
MDLKEVKVSLSGVVNSMNDTLKDSISQLKELKEAGTDKISELVNNILELAPLIEVTGFNMKDISVDIGIPPGISIAFSKEKDIDSAAIDQLLEENEDKEMLRIIVKSLQKADSAQKAMKLGDYKFRGLNMKLGFPPDMSLKFSRK